MLAKSVAEIGPFGAVQLDGRGGARLAGQRARQRARSGDRQPRGRVAVLPPRGGLDQHREPLLLRQPARREHGRPVRAAEVFPGHRDLARLRRCEPSGAATTARPPSRAPARRIRAARSPLTQVTASARRAVRRSSAAWTKRPGPVAGGALCTVTTSGYGSPACASAAKAPARRPVRVHEIGRPVPQQAPQPQHRGQVAGGPGPVGHLHSHEPDGPVLPVRPA